MISPSTVVHASEQQVSSDLGGETVILSIDDGMYYGLEGSGARIWALLQEPRRVADIHQQLVEEYEVDEKECMRDLVSLLGDLRARQLVVVREQTK